MVAVVFLISVQLFVLLYSTWTRPAPLQPANELSQSIEEAQAWHHRRNLRSDFHVGWAKIFLAKAFVVKDEKTSNKAHLYLARNQLDFARALEANPDAVPPTAAARAIDQLYRANQGMRNNWCHSRHWQHIHTGFQIMNIWSQSDKLSPALLSLVEAEADYVLKQNADPDYFVTAPQGTQPDDPVELLVLIDQLADYWHVWQTELLSNDLLCDALDRVNDAVVAECMSVSVTDGSPDFTEAEKALDEATDIIKASLVLKTKAGT